MQAVALATFALLSIALDQASKAWVLRRLGAQALILCGPIGIRQKLNRRAFRGPLSHHGLLFALILAEAAALAILVQFAPLFAERTVAIALGAAVGGAASNALDQKIHGGVIDFIDLGFWPVFNLADVAIVGGIGAALTCL